MKHLDRILIAYIVHFILVLFYTYHFQSAASIHSQGFSKPQQQC
jgi:hypothetical protein